MGGARSGADVGRAGPRNDFGFVEALIGLAAGFLLDSLAVTVLQSFDRATGHRPPGSFGTDAAELIGLWTGFLGAALVAGALHRRAASPSGPPRRRSPFVALRDDYGLVLRPWPDIPLGIVVGLASQYLLVPVLELPLLPFVPHLFKRLGGPAQSLTVGAHGGVPLAVIGVLVCVGSPLFEELFFRGLLLRALAGRCDVLGPRLGPVLAVALTAVVFGLVHFEALQLLALIGFGVVLCVLAWRSGRLGPGIVAHCTFNAVTIIAIALSR